MKPMKPMKNLMLRGWVAASLAVAGLAVVAVPAHADVVPQPIPVAPPGLEDKVNTILGLIMYLVIAACVAGILFVAGKLALAHRRGESGEAAGQLGGVAAACVLVGSGAAIVKFLYA
jgi:hypothetical protein